MSERLWVGRRKEPSLGYISKYDEKRIRAFKGKPTNIILYEKLVILFSQILLGMPQILLLLLSSVCYRIRYLSSAQCFECFTSSECFTSYRHNAFEII